MGEPLYMAAYHEAGPRTVIRYRYRLFYDFFSTELQACHFRWLYTTAMAVIHVVLRRPGSLEGPMEPPR